MVNRSLPNVVPVYLPVAPSGVSAAGAGRATLACFLSGAATSVGAGEVAHAAYGSTSFDTAGMRVVSGTDLIIGVPVTGIYLISTFLNFNAAATDDVVRGRVTKVSNNVILTALRFRGLNGQITGYQTSFPFKLLAGDQYRLEVENVSLNTQSVTQGMALIFQGSA